MTAPSEEQIAKWKEEYEKVFLIDSGKDEYVFRSIGFEEYERALEIDAEEGSAEADDYLVETALLYPEPTKENLEAMPALFASTLSEYILDFSCFGEAQNAVYQMQEERQRAEQDLKSVMMSFVLAAFPYTPEDLEKESFFSLSRKVALAERVMELRQALDRGIEVELRLDDNSEQPQPEQPQQQQRPPQQQPQQQRQPQDKNQEVLQKLRSDMDKAMSYVTNPGAEYEFED